MSLKPGNSSVVFGDLFAKLEERTKEREEWLKNNPPLKLTVRQALSIALYMHENNYEASHVYEVLMPSKYSDPVFHSKDVLDVTGDDYADGMIEHWRSKLFISKMFDSRKLSEWRAKLSHVIADPNRIFETDDVPTIASFPRFHEYEIRYERLGNDYKTFDKRKKKIGTVNLDLTYIEHWEEKNSKNGRRNVYAFKSKDNYLVLLSLRPTVSVHSHMMLQELLKFTNQFRVRGRVYTKIVDAEKYALQFDNFIEFEAIVK